MCFQDKILKARSSMLALCTLLAGIFLISLTSAGTPLDVYFLIDESQSIKGLNRKCRESTGQVHNLPIEY